MEKLRIVIVEPGKEPYEREIDHTLEKLQGIVEGDIETTWDEGLPKGTLIVCNEEGKLLGLPQNRVLWRDGRPVDVVAGTFFVVGTDEADFASLTDEQVKVCIENFQE